MSYKVAVAPLAPSHGHLRFDSPLGDQTEQLRWEERWHVELDVTDDETLFSILHRAKREFDPKPRLFHGPGDERDLDPAGLPYDLVRFYEEDDDPPNERPPVHFARELITLDEQGRARWNRDPEEIRFGDLRRAAAAGLLPGDPFRPYFVLNYPQGGGLLIAAWPVFLKVLHVLGDMLTAREVGRLTAREVTRVHELLEGSAVVESHVPEWTARGGGPYDVRKTIEWTPWKPEELRMIMGLQTDEQAASLLELFGYSPNSDGYYALDDAAEARIIRLAEEEAFRIIAFGGRGSEVSEEMVSQRLKILLDTGEVPKDPPPYLEAWRASE